jgi:peptide/nickel transport system permease protein
MSRRLGTLTLWLGGIIVAVVIGTALFAPLLAPYDPVEINMAEQLLPPGHGHHILGTDQVGRDVLSRMIWGTRPALLVGSLAVLIALAGGVPIGLVAGYYKGTILEEFFMRSMEILASIPLLIWAIAVVGILGVGTIPVGPWQLPNEAKVIVIVGVLNIPGIARITHAAALVETTAGYVAARRAQGARQFEIMVGDVLPNCLSSVIVQATLLVAIGMIVEASLSFVGLGVQPPKPSWGGMLADARSSVFTGEWWLSFFPGASISIAVIGFNLLGDALRDLMDPRNRRTGAERKLPGEVM